jgi:hypothetical protein
MIATVELQVLPVTIASSVLSALRQNPPCLPPATSGLQLQRVRLLGATLRNSKAASYRLQMAMGGHDQGIPWDDITGKQVQLAVDVTADIAQVARIATNPNGLVTPDVSISATLIFDLDCTAASPRGWVELAYRLDEVLPTGALAPLAGLTPQWVEDQVAAHMALKPMKLDLGAMIAPGQGFANAGLAMDAGASVVAARAEVSAHPAMVNRWRVFHNGGVINRLGPNDWGVVVLGNQLAGTLADRVRDSMRESLGAERHRLISVGGAFLAQPGRAVFVLTPYVELPVVGTEPLPISVAMTVDGAAGSLVVDIDAYGVRDFVGSFTSTVGVILRILIPILGSFVAAALNDAVAGAMQTYSTKLAGTMGSTIGDLPGAGAGSVVDEVPGLPFRYRATLPLPVPPLAQARVQELVTSPDAFVLGGSWAVLNFVEGELAVDVSGLGWQAPRVACGAPGEAVLLDIASNPMKYIWLYGEVKLEVTGSARARLCAVTVLTPLDPSLGVKVRWSATNLPTRVEIIAPSDVQLAGPIELEIRTTHGVLRARVAPPRPLTPADIRRIRSEVRMQLALCDAIIKPEWFNGAGRFSLDWIVDPLLDPDHRDMRIDVVDLSVSGLTARSQVSLARSSQASMASAWASADGVAQLQFASRAGDPVPEAMLKPASARRSGPRSAAGGVVVLRRSLERVGDLLFRTAIDQVLATDEGAAGTFFVRSGDRVFLVDARDPARAEVVRDWHVPGLRGVVPVRRGAVFFGAGGLRLMEDLDPESRSELVWRAEVDDVCATASGVAVLSRQQVHLFNPYGVELHRIAGAQAPRGLLGSGAQLLVTGDGGMEMFGLHPDGSARRTASVRTLDGSGFFRSGLDGTPFLARANGSCVQLELGPRACSGIAAFAEVPWVCRMSRSGLTVLVPEGRHFVAVTRLSPTELVAPRRRARDGSPGAFGRRSVETSGI